MMRQNQTPVQYSRDTRPDAGVIVTSGRAGKVTPLGFVPLFPGDSMGGQASVSITLREMPKPILNAVQARFQAWFVPRSALPQFSGLDEYIFAYQGQQIKALGAADRAAPSLYDTVSTGAIAALQSSELIKAVGLHLAASTAVNTDYIDAFNLVYNFRLAAHSKNLTRRDYYQEDAATSVTLPPAFWPSNAFGHIIPDYETALVKGSLELDMIAGRLPVSGLGHEGQTYGQVNSTVYETDGTGSTTYANSFLADNSPNNVLKIEEDPNNSGFPGIYAELAGQTIPTSLIDIDKARTTQAFAKLRSSYQGADGSGFRPDDALIGHMMQGLSVPPELYNKPWMLDSQIVTFGLVERHATDAANLDDSSTTGEAEAVLALNVPKSETGGIVVYTVEVFPERYHERASDEYLYCVDRASMPDPERDLQRTLPVDSVLNRRVDALHTTPAGVYGYEGMNMRWHRQGFTRMGGEYRQDVPGTPVATARFNVWHPDLVNPSLNVDHYLCPTAFSHDVFLDTTGHCWDAVVRQDCAKVGHLVQTAETPPEDNGEYVDTLA